MLSVNAFLYSGADMLNKHFVEVIDELVNRSSRKNGNTAQVQNQRINFCPKTVFLCPVTEDEIEPVTKILKGKPSAGYDEIPEYVVKQCIKYIKKPLVHIYNASLGSGTFPDRLKIENVIPLHKKVASMMPKTIDLYLFYQYSLKY
jgi:hypothetical protein